jgi:hypothetical protein
MASSFPLPSHSAACRAFGPSPGRNLASQTSIERLEEIRLAALEQRIEAELGAGRHAELIGELEQLMV